MHKYQYCHYCIFFSFGNLIQKLSLRPSSLTKQGSRMVPQYLQYLSYITTFNCWGVFCNIYFVCWTLLMLGKWPTPGLFPRHEFYGVCCLFVCFNEWRLENFSNLVLFYHIKIKLSFINLHFYSFLTNLKLSNLGRKHQLK